MVSVIIPVYNVEPYLNRCVDSVLAQTYANLEIILVDDGAPDGCGAICDEYAGKDDRVRVLHKTNGGISSARNAGIDAASGQYLAFVDSDDWVDRTFIERLRETLIENEADMSACLFCRAKDEKEERQRFQQTAECITSEKFFSALTENSYAGYACNKLFKRDIIENNLLRFDERIFNGEDFLFVLKYIQYVKQVAFIKEDLYFYFFNQDGMMHRVRLNERFLTVLCAREKALELLSRVAPDCYGVCMASYLSILCKIKYMAMADLKKYSEIYRQVNEKLKTARKGLLRLQRVSLKTKFKLWLMIYYPRICARAYQKKVKLVG